MSDKFAINGRLFSYIVRYDAGTAPNPDHGMCSLAICKPSIRRVATRGDWVVGLAPASEKNRLVYCMRVDAKMSWREYIVACNEGTGIPDGFNVAAFTKRVPKRRTDLGDCIWKNAEVKAEPRPTASNHRIDDFKIDVISGQSVLVSKNFYYFGCGNRAKVFLDESLNIIVPGRGHRSDANNPYRLEFSLWLKRTFRMHEIDQPGKYGVPKLRRDLVGEGELRACRLAESVDELDDAESRGSSFGF